MPTLFDTQPAVGYQLRLTGFCIQRIQRLGIDSIYIRRHRKTAQQHIPIRPDGAGKLPQNPFDFFFFFGYIPFDIVIQIHHSHGLDEQRGPGAALIMYDAGEVSPVLLFDGNHIPIPPHGDQRILKKLLVVRVMQYLFQLRAHLGLGGRNSDTEPGQFHGSRIQDLPFFRNALFQLAHQLGKLRQIPAIFRQIRMVVAFCQQEDLQRPKGLHAGFDLHQLFHVQHTADTGPLHCFGNIVQTPERKTPARVYNPQRFRRFHVHALHGLKIRGDGKRQQPFLPQLSSCFFRSPLFYFVKFQRFDGKTP